jgi:LysR family carnitine catabolism transcriptional activator
MELRQLAYVVAVVDHGGFTRAAAEVHVAQPSLSQAVRSLERELGVELFHRVGRGVVLSAAGEALLGPARQALRSVEIARAAVSAVTGLERGHLDLVALPTLAVDPTAALVGAFRAAHPDVIVRLAEPEDVAEVIAMVRDGRCEIGLADIDDPGPELVTEPLVVQQYRVVCPPGVRIGRGDRVTIAQLADIPLVTTPSGTSTRQLLDRAFADAGFEPKVAVETGQREALLPLVLAGAGTALLPVPLALEAAARGATVLRLQPKLTRAVQLVYRSGPLSPAAQAFIVLARSRRSTG